jgi:hypothetical protein
MPKPSTKPSIPLIPWDADQHSLTWALLTELKKHENFKVLFGKRDPKEVCQHFLSGAMFKFSSHLHFAFSLFRTPLAI